MPACDAPTACAIMLALFVIYQVALMVAERSSSFVPVRARCSGGAAQSPVSYGVNDIDGHFPLSCTTLRDALPHEFTVRDGTVAPLTAKDPAIVIARGLGAGAPGIAAYMEHGVDPETGIARVAWFRAMADPIAGAAARARPPTPGLQLTPGMPGSLVPESLRPTNTGADADRPMSLRAVPNLMAGYADGGDSPSGYNADYVTDGYFGSRSAEW